MVNRDLQLGLWMLTLRARQRALLLTLLVLLDILCIGIAALQGARFARTSPPSALATVLALPHEPDVMVLERLAPPVLRVAETALVATTGTTYDAVAVITNPSPRWLLTHASYAFRTTDLSLAEGTFSLGPNEERFLIVPGLRRSTVSLPSDVQLATAQLQWQRNDPNEPSEPAFVVRTPAYRVLSTAPSAPLSSVSAEVINPSVTSTRSANVTAILRNGRTIVGAAQLRLDDLAPGAVRAADIRIFRVLTVTDVQMRAAVVE